MAKRRKVQQTKEGTEENHGLEVAKPKARRGRSLHSMMDLPLDVIYEVGGAPFTRYGVAELYLTQILGHLKPYDLLRLSWTTKKLRQTLMSRSSLSVWKTSLADAGVPRSLSKYMNEPAIARLAFYPFCNFCNESKVLKISWGAFARCCKRCQPNQCDPFLDNALLCLMPKNLNSFAISAVDTVYRYDFVFPRELWKTLPYLSDDPFQWVTRQYSEQAAQKLSDEFSAIEATEVDELKAIQLKEHEEKEKVISECIEWDINRADDREQELNSNRESRFNAIVSKLENAGWGEELAHEEFLTRLSQHKLVKQPKLLTERIWKNIEATLIEFMDELRTIRIDKERKKISRERFKLLDELLRTAEVTLPSTMVMPLDIDVAFWEPFRSVIEDLPLEAGADISLYEEATMVLPQFIEDWNRQRTEESLRALREHRPDATAEDLYTATSLFRCKNQHCPSAIYLYPGIISHHCHRSIFATPSLPAWCDYEYFGIETGLSFREPATTCNFEYASEAANCTRDVCYLYSLDPLTTSSRMITELNPIMECKSCATSGSRTFLRWAQALVHGHVHHELATINEEDSAIVTAEESGVSTGYIPSLLNMRKGERIHRCKHCNFRDGLKSVEDHLREM
ncbi:hypothetical protein VNI00_007823 [Paramarasmius palmivorus]|uniref:F-box domain-containing protein n=1 Tax=Paramarasmius palmivorus TaxID=297713 RepID=A0AAW0D006_9AGAR